MKIKSHWMLVTQMHLVGALISIAVSLIAFNVVVLPLLDHHTDTKLVRVLTVTSYSPRVVETDSTPFINACGSAVAEGQVAVSRDLWLAGWVCGRKIWVQDIGILTIMDRMNPRYEDSVDIFRFNTRKAKRFGRQKRIVALLGR